MKGEKTMGLEVKNEIIYKQYNFNVSNIYRIRGAIILDTDCGLKIMREYNLSEGKAEITNCILNHLIENGFKNVDLISRNINGNLISYNQYGTPYIVKNFFPGEECCLQNKDEICMAIKVMAHLHNSLRGVDFTKITDLINKNNENQDILEEGNGLDTEDRTVKIIIPKKNIKVVMENHSKEIKRVYKYISEKKKKNKFEVDYLSVFNMFKNQGDEAIDILGTFEYEKAFSECIENNVVYHGEFNQHNILKYINSADELECAISGFDKAGIGIQIFDLYQFLRKCMEKNDWDRELGREIIDTYVTEREKQNYSVNDYELKILLSLLVFPDKLWKIADYYYNRRKTWLSARLEEKLEKVKLQERVRAEFIGELGKKII